MTTFITLAQLQPLTRCGSKRFFYRETMMRLTYGPRHNIIHSWKNSKLETRN